MDPRDKPGDDGKRWAAAALFAIAVALLLTPAARAEDAPVWLGKTAQIDWNHVLRDSVTNPTLQVVVNPKLQPNQVVARNAFAALRDLAPDYARYAAWYPYPKMSVAELAPPTGRKTFWNFDRIDPPVLSFLEATKGRHGYLSFSTIPEWMFATPLPVPYPADPDQADFDYAQGTELADPTGKQLADYYGRLAAWYVKGGFTDELGAFHRSKHHYELPLFEVLNEVDIEHRTTPEQYARRYDAIVSSVRAVSPGTQFIGLALASPTTRPDFFDYFLDPAHHLPGIPLDWISYHFYATPAAAETAQDWQYTVFNDASGFVDTVRYIEAIRRRLSPGTRTMINETGVILRRDFQGVIGGKPAAPEIPDAFWNLSGALYAYLYGELTRLGIEVVGESQLMGFPSQFPSVTMVDWNTGKPNARFQVLKLLRDNSGPGDRIVDAGADPAGVRSDAPIVDFAYIRNGMRKVLLVNRRADAQHLDIPGAAGGMLHVVDQQSAGGPIRVERLGSQTVTLGGFAVAVVDLP